jgi:endogenous inhibitor of DNA gyrase (YacG/DUF329 family)
MHLAATNNVALTANGCQYTKRQLEEIRRQSALEEDEWAMDVAPTSVKCMACQRTLKLDDRSKYQPFHWTRHRERCQWIQLLAVIAVHLSVQIHPGYELMLTM